MKLIFKSLINNDACIEGARKRKWWIGILILLFSLIVSLVPAFVTMMTVKGSAQIASNTYGIEYAIKEFCNDVTESEKTFTIVDKKLESTYTDKFKFITEENKAKENNKVDAVIYYCETMSEDEFDKEYSKVDCSLIVFCKNDFYMGLANPNKGTKSQALHCTKAWKNFSNGDMIKLLNGETSYQIRDNLISFVDKAYEDIKVTTAWIQTGLYAAINLAVVLLMGFMVWILTRGKSNPYRIYTFWDGLKISFWATLAPAILTVPLGFLIKNLMNIVFVMLFGIRVMWLSMKSLRPDGTGYQDTKEVKTVNVKSAK